MPKGVSCSVANCNFWKEGNNCGANAITIEIDQHADAHFNEEFAEAELGELHQDHAEQSKSTCCLTFKPKE
ncbi:hypothetical protein BK133_12865 [Paenibacillus sp. FSL H8-0548]|uniref:DUF1540 domain-containing protein n=1 Tax=Paenibacillus sp. FSL H8-0548 TaxID=1920422 RepID=UPI00096E54FB|nr:DUF1540 domain-containing protein [Paenibacillus sp. FSL H8-0548]OMF34208.1 hypothetical protein BK133_12865 [Paenibacillus sp. FSL H8-0548]